MIDETEEAIRLGRAAKMLRSHELFEPLLAEVKARIVHDWEQSPGGDPAFHAELKGVERFIHRLKILDENGDLAQRKLDTSTPRKSK